MDEYFIKKWNKYVIYLFDICVNKRKIEKNIYLCIKKDDGGSFFVFVVVVLGGGEVE